MQISQSNLTLSATGTALSYSSQSETIRLSRPHPQPAAASPNDTVDISAGAAGASRQTDKLAFLPPALYALALLVERLTGHKIDLLDPSSLDPTSAAQSPASSTSAAPHGAAAPQFDVRIDTVQYEAQTSSFSAQGTVTTADGRQISLDLQATISRQFLASGSQELHVGPAASKDPLVLDLSGAPTQLSPQKISFDINADGQVDQVSMPSAGSALLAIDRNGNGKIDDGSELFGPSSGNGYAELATLDSDKNGWIDSADPAFGQLRLWQPSSDGGGRLETLAQAGVGAVSLQHAATPFSFRAPSTNAELGTLQSTGVFLREDGSAGTVRQIDVDA